MDDSTVALMPPEIAEEATQLRRDMEDRHRRFMQQRMFTQGSGGRLSTLLRQANSKCLRLYYSYVCVTGQAR